MAYGTKTLNLLDKPLAVASQVAKFLNANGADWTDVNSARLLSGSYGTIGAFNEASSTFAAFNVAALNEQVMTIAYNKGIEVGIPRTLIQDTPIASLVEKIATEIAEEQFIPDFDAYALNAIYAGVQAANKISWDHQSSTLKQKVFNVHSAIKQNGGLPARMIGWLPYSVSDLFKALVTTFDGSNLGYEAGQNGVLGPIDGVMVIETNDSYFPAGTVKYIAADKRAIFGVPPKQDPQGDGLDIIPKSKGFSGPVLQLRSRGDVFIANQKKLALASLETATS
ncbi:MAG TPA: hypothetical protein VN081_02260 [Dongiaceae bacterium]|nr:hypothetical protein [Dongiaceae bacterium]